MFQVTIKFAGGWSYTTTVEAKSPAGAYRAARKRFLRLGVV